MIIIFEISGHGQLKLVASREESRVEMHGLVLSYPVLVLCWYCFGLSLLLTMVLILVLSYLWTPRTDSARAY